MAWSNYKHRRPTVAWSTVFGQTAVPLIAWIRPAGKTAFTALSGSVLALRIDTIPKPLLACVLRVIDIARLTLNKAADLVRIVCHATFLDVVQFF